MSPLCFSFGYCANYQASQENAVVDFKDWQIPLGRRFRYHSLYMYNACCINPAICVLSGNFILRFAVGAPLTEDRHIKIAWQVLQEQATTLLKDY
ncbi:hypothetical protein B296_00006910 [Ensete ventricosum]|uniref:Uncharacterized protein n=1 Tax=Ensete ventricosum TaxID=4639 RepID=A0A427AWP9_ENSVE|nr:hypothetical protein B296_00006910 [Ensete ventricosum]